MQVFKDVDELKHAPAEIRDHLSAILGNETDSFEVSLGGWVCVVEDLADLAEVVTASPSPSNPGQWASVLECPGAIDSVQWVGEYLEFLLCSNNAGGTTYYIPRAIVAQCPNLGRSIEMTTAPSRQPE